MTLNTNFRPSKCFRYNEPGSRIQSIDFDDTGNLCIVTSSDNIMQLYDCQTGQNKKKIFSQKYGVHLARFTHATTSVIYASTKTDKTKGVKGDDNTIRYLDTHGGSFIRYFAGHEESVVSLEVCPVNDQFLSGSVDNTVRVWDLRSRFYHGLLNIPGPSQVAFDPNGMIFAVASRDLSSILLYDLRNYDKEPFSTFSVSDDDYLSQFSYPPRMPEWARVEFSNDGKQILINTVDSGAHYILDAFTGEIRHRLRGFKAYAPTGLTAGDACFTPDANYVFSGSGDGKIVVWDVTADTKVDLNLDPFNVLEASTFSAPQTLAFNPRNALLVTGNEELLFWLPD